MERDVTIQEDPSLPLMSLTLTGGINTITYPQTTDYVTTGTSLMMEIVTATQITPTRYPLTVTLWRHLPEYKDEYGVIIPAGPSQLYLTLTTSLQTAYGKPCSSDTSLSCRIDYWWNVSLPSACDATQPLQVVTRPAMYSVVVRTSAPIEEWGMMEDKRLVHSRQFEIRRPQSHGKPPLVSCAQCFAPDDDEDDDDDR